MIPEHRKDFATPIRRRDPFRPYLDYKKRIQRDKIVLIGAGLFLLLFLLRALTGRGSYAILVDGTPVVVVKGKKNARRVMKEVEKMGEGKGELREQLRLAKAKGEQPLLAPEKALALLQKKVHIVIPAYLFKVKQKVKFALEDKNALLRLLQDFKKSYCQRIVPPPFDAQYKSSFQIEPSTLSANRVKSLNEIRSLFFSMQKPLLTVTCRKKQKIAEDIPFKTEVVKDPSLYSDIRIILQDGVPGKKEKEVLFIYENGNLKQKKVLKETIILQPTPKKMKIGTRRKPSLSSRAKRKLNEKRARRIYLQYRHGNHKGHFRGVYGMKELGVDVGTAHSLDHAFGVHFVYNLSWQRIVSYLQKGDFSFGRKWGCSGGPHNPRHAALIIKKAFLSKSRT